jgi:hypothetical protein
MARIGNGDGVSGKDLQALQETMLLENLPDFPRIIPPA